MRAAHLSRALSVVSIVATALWVGGLIALGAIAAPIVFGMVPAPASADAMTAVFRRFDRLAIACIAIVLLTEVAQAVVRKPLTRIDGARVLVSVLGTVLILWQAFAVSPAIDALHRAGAIRGFGELGERLEAAHKLAEFSGKLQLVFGIALIALHVWSFGGPSREDRPR